MKSFENRCLTCLQLKTTCICSFTPHLESQIPFLLVQHSRERCRSSNTGRLLQLAFPQIPTFLHEKPEDVQALTQTLQNYPGHAFVVFPSTSGVSIEDLQHLQKEQHPFCLILLDGSWRQAKRMKSRIPILRTLPCISLKAPSPSNYLLRKQNREEGLSTVEAAILLMKELQCAPYTLLEDFYQRMMQHSLLMRGIPSNASSQSSTLIPSKNGEGQGER
jgi:DTW domain-containing protein YfiP